VLSMQIGRKEGPQSLRLRVEKDECKSLSGITTWAS